MYYVAPETPMMSSVIADCLDLVPPPNIMDKSTPMEKPLTFISFLHRPSGTVMELHVGHQVRKGVVSREKPETALAWFVAASSDLVTRKSLQWYYARFGWSPEAPPGSCCCFVIATVLIEVTYHVTTGRLFIIAHRNSPSLALLLGKWHSVADILLLQWHTSIRLYRLRAVL